MATENKPATSTGRFYKKGVFNAILILLIIVLALGYQLVDFVRMELKLELIYDIGYWVSVILTIVFMLIFLLSVRALRKNYDIYKSQDINDYSDQVRKSFMWVTENNYSSKVEYYIYTLNKKDKYDCYRRYWLAKIAAIKDEDKRNKKKVYLTKTADDVWEMKLGCKYKYRPIKYSKLFQGVHSKDVGVGVHDINDYEKTEITVLLSTKALWVLAFSAFTAVFAVTLAQQNSVIEVIYNIVVKLVQLGLAIWFAIDAADNFVFINLATALRNKYGILASFKAIVNDLVVPDDFDPIAKLLKETSMSKEETSINTEEITNN